MRSGLYAVYNDREMKAAKTMDGHIKLVVDDNPPQGFEKTAYGNYVKTVDSGEVNKLFIVKSYVQIDGKSYEIESEQDGYYTVAMGGYGKSEDYHKKVAVGDVKRIYEKKRVVG